MDDDRMHDVSLNQDSSPVDATAQPLNETAELSATDGEAGTTQAPEPLPPLPLTPDELLAQELIGVLNDFASRFPGLVYPTPKEERRARRHRTVPRIFMQGAMTTVSQSVLKRTSNFNIDDMRDALHFVDAFAAVMNRINYLQGAVKYTIDAKKSVLADASLQIYGVAKEMARAPENAELAGWVKLLKGYLGRKGRGRKVRTPPPTSESPESPA